MRQFNVEFFDRTLTYKHRDSAYNIIIDDDYISAVTNNMEISSTDKVVNGDFIYITTDDIKFFGIVTDVSPGEYTTSITYKPFMSLFDEDFLFNYRDQGTGERTHPTLEEALENYIKRMYITTPDTTKRLNIEVINSVPEANKTSNWSFNITPMQEGSVYNIVNLYTSIITAALKKYGVAILVEPIFSAHKIRLNIVKINSTFKIDGDLDNVKVQTLKYNERPNGVNKLVVYNSSNFSETAIFYVHPDRTWDLDGDNNRITPVVTKVTSVTPDETYGFAGPAVEAAYSTFSGTEWDNLIELQTVANDPIIAPMDLDIGQKITLYYKGGVYTSILTGRHLETDLVTLYFGSERIQYSKRRYKIGGQL